MLADVAAGDADGGHTSRGGVARQGRRTPPTASIGRRRVVGGHVAGLLVDIVDDTVEGDAVDRGSRQVQGEDGMERERNGLAKDGDLGRRAGLARGRLCGNSRSLEDGARSLLLVLLCLGIAGALDRQAFDIELLDAGRGAPIAGIALHTASVGIASGRGRRRRCAQHPLAVLEGIGEVAADGGIGDDDGVAVAAGADARGVDVAKADGGLVGLGGRYHRHLHLPARQLGDVGIGRGDGGKLVELAGIGRVKAWALRRHLGIGNGGST